MIARCARCQGTFTTDRYGLLVCPHCGSELLLADPNAPKAASGEPPPGPPAPAGAPPGAPSGAGAPPPQAPPAQLPPAQPPPGGGGGWPPPGGFAPPPGPGGPDLPSPFADRARVGFLAGVIETFKRVATRPEEFFRRVRVDQTGSAVLFAVLAFTVGTAFQTLYALLSREQMLVLFGRLSAFLSQEQIDRLREALRGASAVESMAEIVFAPIVAVVAIYLLSAMFHLVLILLRGAPRGFDATVTVVAYAFGLMLLLAVPVCGGLVAGVWAIVSAIMGLGQAQRCGSGKAAAAVLSPVILACLCCCGIAGIGAPAILKGLGDAASGARETTL
jgi:hypothetical protein